MHIVRACPTVSETYKALPPVSWPLLQNGLFMMPSFVLWGSVTHVFLVRCAVAAWI